MPCVFSHYQANTEKTDEILHEDNRVKRNDTLHLSPPLLVDVHH